MQVFTICCHFLRAIIVNLILLHCGNALFFWSLSSKMPHDITRASEDTVKKIEALPQYVFAGIPICIYVYPVRHYMINFSQ